MKALDIIMYLASLGVFSLLGAIVWGYARGHIKSQKLRQVGDFALQAVQYAELTASHLPGAQQKAVAINFIGDLLKKAHLDSLVTPEQVDAELELALLKLKQMGGTK